MMENFILDEYIEQRVAAAIDRRLLESKAELLTTDEAAKYLKCSSAFIWKLRKCGKLNVIKAGAKVLIPKSELENFIKANMEGQDNGK